MIYRGLLWILFTVPNVTSFTLSKFKHILATYTTNYLNKSLLNIKNKIHYILENHSYIERYNMDNRLLLVCLFKFYIWRSISTLTLYHKMIKDVWHLSQSSRLQSSTRNYGECTSYSSTLPMIASSTVSMAYNQFNANWSINKETERELEVNLKEIVDPKRAPRFQDCLLRGSPGPLNYSNEPILFMAMLSVTSALQSRESWGFPVDRTGPYNVSPMPYLPWQPVSY